MGWAGGLGIKGGVSEEHGVELSQARPREGRRSHRPREQRGACLLTP